MRIQDFLSVDRVLIDIDCTERSQLLHRMVSDGFLQGQCESLESDDLERIVEVLEQRETMCPTGIKNGLAIPHAKVAGVNALCGCVGIVPAGLTWGAVDNGESNIIFILLAPENRSRDHLKALARIARLFGTNTSLGRRLLDEPTPQQVYETLTLEDAHLEQR